MKLTNVGVIVPIDVESTGERMMVRFRFYGTVDRRRMRRMIRKNLTAMHIHTSNQHLNWFIRHRKYPIFETPEAQ